MGCHMISEDGLEEGVGQNLWFADKLSNVLAPTSKDNISTRTTFPIG